MKLAIMGAAGRMGRAIAQIIEENPECEIVGGIESEGSPNIGADIGELAGLGRIGVPITSDTDAVELFTKVQGIIDFTTPAASVAFADLAAQARIVHVIGTTGFSRENDETIFVASRHARIVKSGNMSLGVNLLAALVKKAAQTLGTEFDIEILEMHHRHKVDAPSGTALLLGEAAAHGRKVALENHAVRVRDGHTGPRNTGDIGFATLRGGDVVGDHTVMFAGAGERIELTHRATDRRLFARGAVQAALWANNEVPGLYSMNDVLGL
jgi:4-hydroxy-tetrahydrodipicolinate reductase